MKKTLKEDGLVEETESLGIHSYLIYLTYLAVRPPDPKSALVALFQNSGSIGQSTACGGDAVIVSLKTGMEYFMITAVCFCNLNTTICIMHCGNRRH